MKPLKDRIIVRQLPEETVSKGGILLPDNATKKPQEGDVVFAGPGRVLDNGQLKPLDVKVGDRIIFTKYSGMDVQLGGETLLIMREDDVLAVREAQ